MKRNQKEKIMRTEEKTIGAIIYNDDNTINTYKGDYTDNGYCFKDTEAWKSGEGICYIGEYALAGIDEQVEELEEELENGQISEEEFKNQKIALFADNGYTREQIVEMCGGKGFEKLAESIFYEVDWQEPQTLFSEMDTINLEEYGITREMIENNPVWAEWSFIDEK